MVRNFVVFFLILVPRPPSSLAWHDTVWKENYADPQFPSMNHRTENRWNLQLYTTNSGCLRDLSLYHLNQSSSAQKLQEAVGLSCENKKGTTDLQTHGAKRLHLIQHHQKYTFSSSEHVMLSRIEHILGHKTNLHKFIKIEIMQSTYFKHSGMKVELNCIR